MTFHSNLETNYDPDYLDSKLKMQYLMSGSPREKKLRICKAHESEIFLLFDC